MSDINEKKIDHYIYEMLQIKTKIDCLLFSLPLCPWTLTLSARLGNFVQYISKFSINKAGYMATEVACGWAGAIFEVTRSFGQEL